MKKQTLIPAIIFFIAGFIFLSWAMGKLVDMYSYDPLDLLTGTDFIDYIAVGSLYLAAGYIFYGLFALSVYAFIEIRKTNNL